MRSWYDLAVKEKQRTTVGVSGLEINQVVEFVGAFIDSVPANPREIYHFLIRLILQWMISRLFIMKLLPPKRAVPHRRPKNWTTGSGATRLPPKCYLRLKTGV